MKRVLSILLAALFAVSLVGFASAADMSTPAPVKKKHHMRHKKKAPAAVVTPAPETK